jgi:hypothetical protein
MWEELRETEHLVEGSCRSRQSSFGFGKEVALAVHHLHAKTSRVGMGVHEVEALGKSIVLHHRVGIEQEHILACRNADGLVIGTAEANVFLVGDDLYLGELLCQHLQRSINRVVVNNKHFSLNALQCSTHRSKALLQEILDVVVDDDDGKLHTINIGQK